MLQHKRKIEGVYIFSALSITMGHVVGHRVDYNPLEKIKSSKITNRSWLLGIYVKICFEAIQFPWF